MITIIDYGMGNLRNVRRACQEIGEECIVTSDPDDLNRAEEVILPGVGAFGEAVRRIDGLGLRAGIIRHVEAGKPMLGICLGMQLLFESSDESPTARGLGVIAGAIWKFGNDVKVPHIGWNDVEFQPEAGFPGQPEGEVVYYFVHSYYAPVIAATVARTSYGVEFSAAVRKGNVFGVQFHPEKSQAAGLAILQGFSRIR